MGESVMPSCGDIGVACQKKRLEEKIAEMEAVLKDIDNYRPQRRWISVDEKMPENKKEVLGLGRSDEYEITFYDIGVWWTASGEDDIERILYWMPLPEGPNA